MSGTEKLNAEVVAVLPNKIKISVDKLEDFKIAEESLKIGSYLKISDNENTGLIAVISNYLIEVDEDGKRQYIIEANPLGILKDGIFKRGGDELAIPPEKTVPLPKEDIKKIYQSSIGETEKFVFSSLSQMRDIDVPVNGNKFFNKHIAVVGATGSGKSCAVARIIQNVISAKAGKYDGLNNSHIIIFDIHSEYKKAFSDANYINIDNMRLPYWLLNSEELEQILLDTGDRDNYNQSSVFRSLVTENKRKHNKGIDKVFYDSPLFFDINEIENALVNLKNETKNSKSSNRYMLIDKSYALKDGKTEVDSGIELNDEERWEKYFEKVYKFHPTKNQNVTKGDYADGTLDKFVSRFQAKIRQDRLEFLFGEQSKKITFEDAVKKFIGYKESDNANVTIIDLNGVPFEALSITVSLISRILFEYGYYYKKIRTKNDPEEKINNDTPLLLVYEEAHRYVPKSDLVRYRASKNSIERIAKEGRKYGVSLLIASQRPSEISETIFSQCNNFIVMRLTNPDDQNYIKRLLPDTLGSMTETLPSLEAGEALLIGDSVVMPSIVYIKRAEPEPSSNDIPYLDIWKEQWKEVKFSDITSEWKK